MALIQSQTAKGRRPIASLVTTIGGPIRVEIDFTVADYVGVTPALNDVIEMTGALPDDMQVVDYQLDSDVLDSNGTPLLTLAFGILNAGKTALATTLTAANSTFRAGGLVRNAAQTCMRNTGIKGTYPNLGFVVTAAPATWSPTKLGVVLEVVARQP